MSEYITGKRLSRRTFLRGAGAAVALPFLDAMRPAFASTPPALASAPARLAFVYIPNGVIMESWKPSGTGAAFEFPWILEPLKPYKDDLLVLSGLAQHNGEALGDGAGDHARATATFLTGVHPKKTNGADIRNGISADQVAAQAIGHRTRFASLELTVEQGRFAGNCDSGYSCAYSNSVSWRNAHTPNPPEHDPRQVFERLFGAAKGVASADKRAKRKRYNQSILDFVNDDAKRLARTLGASDRRKVDEYLFAVRSVEKQIESAEEAVRARESMGLEAPDEKPESYAAYARLMYDLQALALQTDQTRIMTFMMGNEGSNRPYREVGVDGGHHGLSHHRGDKDKIADIRKINRYHAEQFAYFVEKLKSIPEGDGTLLDHTMVVYGSGISDGNRHTHHDLPVVLAGGRAANMHPGRHLEYAENTPLNNLYLAMLDRVGVPTETLGDSTGKLEHLYDL